MIVCDYDELVKALREHAEWMGPNNYELPIAMYDDLLKAADAIEELSKPKWISVKDQLPEQMTRVLVHFQSGANRISEVTGLWGSAFSFEGIYGPATHWMPLPEPPEVDHD